MSAAEAAWREFLGPMLNADEVQATLETDHRTVQDLSAQGVLLALPALDGRILYPAFQFSRTSHPYAEIQRVLEIFEGAVETPWTIASWFMTPQDLLEETTPVHWMQAGREPETLFESARRAAARLGQ